jgi:hypothetical protein
MTVFRDVTSHSSVGFSFLLSVKSFPFVTGNYTPILPLYFRNCRSFVLCKVFVSLYVLCEQDLG